jgi:hypothetical protein
MNQRLQHDVALMMAQHCVELMMNLLDEVQQRQAREGFYEICKAGIECYEVQSDRMQQRLRPMSN